MPGTPESTRHNLDKRVQDKSLGPLLGGMAAILIAMGIGRFAYTPILPAMQRATHLSAGFFGLLGSVTLMGYLVGAVVAATWFAATRGPRRIALIRWAITGVVVTTTGMGMSADPAVWIAMRGASGVFSAFVFVLASGVILDWAAAQGTWTLVGIFYSGVGLGIALSGILTPPLLQIGGWRSAWVGFGALSLALALLPWLLLREHGSVSVDASSTRSIQVPPPKTGILPWVIAAYAMEGVGYIVTGTFLVAMLDATPHLRAIGSDTWIIVGLAAAPSSWLWTRAADRIGSLTALVAAFAMQTIGVLLPVVISAPAAAIIGAALFGGTFMGITGLSMSVARAGAGEAAGRLVGWMTALYSVGQVTGPLAAGILVDATGGYAAALGSSAAVLLGACILLLVARQRTRTLAEHTEASVI